MISRVESVNEKTLEDFTGLVKDVKMEFEAKALKVQALHVFSEIIPEEVQQDKLQELYDELSLDLNSYLNEMQEEASKADMSSPKRSEILQAGVSISPLLTVDRLIFKQKSYQPYLESLILSRVIRAFETCLQVFIVIVTVIFWLNLGCLIARQYVFHI